MMAQIHTITASQFGDVVDEGDQKFSDWPKYFCDKIGNQINSAVDRKIITDVHAEFFTSHLSFLNRIQQTSTPTLVHRDFRPSNILIDTDNWVLSAILDFEVAQFWVPEWDLARTVAELEYPEDKLYLCEPLIEGYLEQAGINNAGQLCDKIKYYKVFESLYYWLWGWDRGYRDDIKDDIHRVTGFSLK